MSLIFVYSLKIVNIFPSDCLWACIFLLSFPLALKLGTGAFGRTCEYYICLKLGDYKCVVFVFYCVFLKLNVNLRNKKNIPQPLPLPLKLHGMWFHSISSCIKLSQLSPPSALYIHNHNLFDLLTNRYKSALLNVFTKYRSMCFTVPAVLFQHFSYIKLFFLILWHS